MSNDLRVMLAPMASYRRLVEEPAAGVRVLARPALVAVVIGAFVTLGNAGQLLPSLLLGSALAWSWVPLLQLAVATPLMALCRRRRVSLAAAIDLFFMGHLPWSLWLMVVGASLLARFPQGLNGASDLKGLLQTGLIPIAWTWVITFSFCRTVLALPRWLSVVWTLGYQAVIWFAAYLYVGAATYRLWPFALFAKFLG